MTETIQEFVSSGGQTLRLDTHDSVLKGVKLLGLTSKNKRVYRESALREAISLYEGARVNVNHPQGDPLAPRDYRDRLGVVRNVVLRPGEGLFGALYFNPRHPLAEQLAWDAEHAPENVGLSHNVLATTTREGEQIVVESIMHVQSVDLVADPATTNGLFEHASPSSHPDESTLIAWSELTLEEVERRRPDLLELLTESHQTHAHDLQAEVESLQRQLCEVEHHRQVLELLAENDLKPPSPSGREREVGRCFFKSLIETCDADEQRRLVQEQAQLLNDKSGAPDARSSEQVPSGFVAKEQRGGVKEFLSAVRGS